ncbi:MAG TPA: hypothetical protein VN428_23815 [Bryobacteraceae bacterium]|nr:hypothetical protein [Bryobacteraceae bacterium]
MARRIVYLLLLVLAGLTAASPEYLSAQRKIDRLRADRVPAGSKVTLTPAELNAYVRAQAPTIAREGIRDPRIELGDSRATAHAYIDFPKLRRSQGQPMGWFLSRLLSGERPVRVEGRIVSSAGRATVEVDRVEVSGIPLTGSALDYVIDNYLHSYYPEAKIGKPFDLAHNIDKLEVRPSGVDVLVASSPSKWRKVAQTPKAAARR